MKDQLPLKVKRTIQYLESTKDNNILHCNGKMSKEAVIWILKKLEPHASNEALELKKFFVITDFP